MSNNKLTTNVENTQLMRKEWMLYEDQKIKHMLNKEWCCDICDNNHNYTLRGKWMHLKTKKHQKNTENE